MCRRPHCLSPAAGWSAEQSRAAAQVRLICADSRFALETTSAAALVPSSWENVESSFSLVCIIKRHRLRKEPRPSGSCSFAGESVQRQVVKKQTGNILILFTAPDMFTAALSDPVSHFNSQQRFLPLRDKYLFLEMWAEIVSDGKWQQA